MISVVEGRTAENMTYSETKDQIQLPILVELAPGLEVVWAEITDFRFTYTAYDRDYNWAEGDYTNEYIDQHLKATRVRFANVVYEPASGVLSAQLILQFKDEGPTSYEDTYEYSVGYRFVGMGD